MSGLGLKKLFTNMLATLGRQVGSGIIQLITLALIARVFGPSGNGAYALALLLPTMLATLLNLGVAPANVYFLGANRVDPKYAWKVTSKISFWIIIAGWITGALIITHKASTFFPEVPVTMLWLSLAFFPLTFTTTNISSFFQGLQDFKKFNIVLLLQPILNLIIISLLIAFSFENLLYVLASYFFSLIITQLIAYRLLKKLLSESSGPKTNGYGKKLINYGYKAHLSNILAFVNYRADMLMLGFFIGPAAVGIYTIAVNITEKLWLLSNAISTVLLPRLSQLSTDEDKRKLLTPLIARWVFWLTLIASLVLAAIGSYIIDLIFGSEFKEAYSAMILLIPGIVVGSCSKVLANDIAARGRPELNLATSWVVVIVNIIANIILIPKFGIQGAAAATSIAYIINFIMRLAMHNYFTKVKFYKNFVIQLDDLHMIKSIFTAKKS